MKPAVLAVAAAVALVACTDLPPLGTCGNGVVEATAGEDCDDPDPARCAECRLVCTADLPASGTCPDSQLCCLAGQRCGVDDRCSAPRGVFASRSAVIPFNATELAVGDVDGDETGDVFGINRNLASFLFGTAEGVLTRTGSAPLPTLSRAESQVGFLDVITSPDAVVTVNGTSSVVVPTPRGFAVLVAADGTLYSPPLPEMEFVDDAGDAIAAAPSESGQIVAVVADAATQRIAVRAFADREVVASDPTPCGQVMPLGAGVATVAQLAVTGPITFEHLVVAITRIRTNPPGLDAALCMYPSPPPPGATAVVFPLPPGTYIREVRAAQLDTDACPEVVAERVQPVPDDLETVIYFDTAPGGGDCVVSGQGVIADGPLLGTGDLDADGFDEVMVGREVFTSIIANPTKLGFELPDGLVRAIVVDVNRDLAPDIVAIGDSPDLTVALATPAGYAPRTVASTGSLRELASGDFDADTFPDVAVVEVLAGGGERIVVAFGGPFGPQQLDSIGEMRKPRSLAAFVDQVPATTSDPFADLFVVHNSGDGYAEVSQFNGSGTRALTSQIDLSGPPPNGDGGASFGRTIVSGELLRPRGDGTDFCTLSMLTTFTPEGLAYDVVLAFCVGGQGAVIASGLVDDKLAFSTGALVDSVDMMPLFAGVQVGLDATGDPFPMIAALRRDQLDVIPALVVMALPPSAEPVRLESQVLDPFSLPALPPGYARQTRPTRLHAVELDGDADSELLVTLLDVVYNPTDLADFTLRSRVYRVDLAAPGGIVTATAAEVIDHTTRDCTDAAAVELGSVIPDGQGTVSVPGSELVVLCADFADPVAHLHAFYRGEQSMVGPFDVGAAGRGLGALTVGDVTGDWIDDLVILYGFEGETRVAVMAQCASHDTATCVKAQ